MKTTVTSSCLREGRVKLIAAISSGTAWSPEACSQWWWLSLGSASCQISGCSTPPQLQPELLLFASRGGLAVSCQWALPPPARYQAESSFFGLKNLAHDRLWVAEYLKGVHCLQAQWWLRPSPQLPLAASVILDNVWNLPGKWAFLLPPDPRGCGFSLSPWGAAWFQDHHQRLVLCWHLWLRLAQGSSGWKAYWASWWSADKHTCSCSQVRRLLFQVPVSNSVGDPANNKHEKMFKRNAWT